MNNRRKLEIEDVLKQMRPGKIEPLPDNIEWCPPTTLSALVLAITKSPGPFSCSYSRHGDSESFTFDTALTECCNGDECGTCGHCYECHVE